MNYNSYTQDDILVNLQEEYKKRQVQEVLDELEQDLIGLVPVKTRIKEIAALLLVHRLRKALGLTSSNPGLHMSFTGSPGTGKTTVALKMADILFEDIFDVKDIDTDGKKFERGLKKSNCRIF